VTVPRPDPDRRRMERGPPGRTAGGEAGGTSGTARRGERAPTSDDPHGVWRGTTTVKKVLRHAWRAVKAPVRVAVGVVLILVGAVGLVLPVMPGWVFIIPGLALATAGTPLGDWLREKVRRLREKMGKRRSRPAEEGRDGPAPRHPDAPPPAG